MQPKTVIFDSSVWIAYFYTQDKHHARAVEVLEKYKTYHFLVPEIIFYETLIRTYQLLQNKNLIIDVYQLFLYGSKVTIVSMPNYVIQKLILKYIDLISLKFSDFQVLLYVVEYEPDEFISFDKRCKREYLKLKSI
jgi:predicted nucleic acid-binding protein